MTDAGEPTDEFLREFTASLPEEYARTFNEEERRAHARVALSRSGRPAAAGRFRSWGKDATALCVVAEDRPGLLARIGAAFLITGLDVIDAEGFTRRTAKRPEAVDIFFVQWASRVRDEPIDDAVVAEFLETLTGLISGTLDASPTSKPPPSDAPELYETHVRFLEGPSGELSVLEVETTDRSGLLMALTHALYEQQVQIVRSEVHTDGGRVVDRFTIVELDDTPIKPERRLDIQVGVLGALQAPA